MSHRYAFDVLDADPAAVEKVLASRAGPHSTIIDGLRVIVSVEDGDRFDTHLPGSTEGWTLQEVGPVTELTAAEDAVRSATTSKAAKLAFADYKRKMTR